jgi:hypothetical protein
MAASSSAMASAGVFHPSVLRGRSFIKHATSFSSVCEILHWVHRVFSNLKTWAKGVFHGLRKRHLRRYLDEFVFRWNRRRHLRSAFDTLLGIGVGLGPATYRDFVQLRA